MKKNISFIMTVVLLTSSILIAQDAPPFQRPAPGPERAKLAFLVGNYTTVTHVMTNSTAGNGGMGKGTSIVTWGLDSMFVMLDEQSINQVLGNYKGHGMLGYDNREAKYVLSMFNNFGDSPQYSGNFTGDTLMLMTKVQYPGGSFDQKLAWYKENNTIRFKVYNDIGDGLVLVIDQTSTPSSNTKN
ncbi:MAG: DUF1579 family protein [Bacteroidota bacterium]